jgi:hypothetical protein
VNGERFSSIVWEIEPNFDKLSEKKKKPEIIILFFAIEFSRMQCKGCFLS